MKARGAIDRLVHFLQRTSGVPEETLYKLLRFCVVGGVSTLAYFLMVVSAIELLRWEPVNASVLSYCGAMLVSYLGQSIVTFRVDTHTLDQVSRFVIVSVVGLFVSWAAMALLTRMWGLHYLVSALFVCFLVPIFSFLAMNIWVFVSRRDKSTLADP